MRRLSVLAMAVAAVAASAFTVIDGRLDDSRLYPGTVHTFKVTLPDAYDPDSPAALYLGLDGILCRAPQVIDSLIATGDIPVMVGVFLQPGYIPGDSSRVLRYNRSNEFDAVDGRFASFIESELLPAVAAITTPDGRPVRFSPSGADHMIFGLSSGGIAAFNAAWHRPDLFARVYSGCGTFVPMRGGHDIQAVVRKHEPLPLRVFLQDGFSDTWNPLFGSWYEANRMLASALELAGCDCAFDWAPGGHSVTRTSAIFPDVMKWMWRGYPQAPAAGTTGNNLLAPLLAGHAQAWIACDSLPADIVPATDTAIYPDGSLMATVDPEGSNYLWQYIIDGNGKPVCGQRYYWLHSADNAPLRPASMTYDGDGNLWVLTRDGIQICDQNGRVRGILRLPADIDIDLAAIALAPGRIYLHTPAATYTRTLNITPPLPGVTPPSQGQG